MKRVSAQLTQSEVEAIRAATSPSTANPFVTESEVAGFGQVTTTYAALSAAALAGTLTPGQKYSFEFQTKQRMIDSDGNEIMALEDAPAPGNITITPDAVGANPVTVYYRAVFFNDETISRSIVSEVIEVTVGNSTTEVIFDCDAIPSWANYVIAFQFESPDYEIALNNGASVTIPYDLMIASSSPLTYLQVLDIPIKQVPGTTPTIITGTTETLVVTATSANTLDPRACSVEYPNDIIEYDWNPANWEHISAFYNSDTSEIVAGWKGVITRRNGHNFDSKNLTYRLWNIAQPTWNEITEFTAGEFVCNGETPALYVALDTSTDVEPGVDEGWETYWKLLYSGLLGWYKSWSPVGWVIKVDGGLYMLPIIDNTVFIDVKYEQDEQSYNNYQERSIKDIPYITCGSNSNSNNFLSGSKFIALPDQSYYNFLPNWNDSLPYYSAFSSVGVKTIKSESTDTAIYQTYIDDSGDNPTFVIAENSVSCSVGA